MRLIEALRLGNSPRLALTGAGGKTSALFCLGREYLEAGQKHVLLAATTHLALEQTRLADRHIILNDENEFGASFEDLPPGLLLFTAPLGQDGRTAGLSLTQMDRLLALAERLGAPLLVEADGARQRALKAPAAHEPVVPAWVETVVVVAGLSGLGQPLTDEWVHRPELFSRLSGLKMGQAVTSEALRRVLSHPEGGLQGIPANARRVVLLSQADNSLRQAAAQNMAPALLQAYQTVVVAEFRNSANAVRKNFGFPEPITAQVYAVHEPVAGVVLAGGSASRFGQPKQTLPWRGQALVWHVARAALEGGLRPVLVVTGYAAGLVQPAVVDLDVQVVYNPGWAGGQSASLIAGLQALPQVGAAIFLLADQPLVDPRLLRSLVETHAATLAPIVAPLIDGQRGNPVLFDRNTFADLLKLEGDVGGRALFSKFPVSWLPWHDRQALFDIDTPQDYQTLLEMGGTEGEA